MRRLLAVSIAVMVSGCMTPGEVRQEGNRFEHSSSLPPAQVVACMGRAIEAYRGDWTARWRESAQPGHYEMLAGADSSSFIADAAPDPSGGSKITIYTRPGLFPSIRESAVDAMKRC